MTADFDWLHVEQGSAPLLLSVPHAGTNLRALQDRFVSPWLARKDADWHVPQLYGFARALGATMVWTDVSRSVIDVQAPSPELTSSNGVNPLPVPPLSSGSSPKVTLPRSSAMRFSRLPLWLLTVT